jgi:hypothetical protein
MRGEKSVPPCRPFCDPTPLVLQLGSCERTLEVHPVRGERSEPLRVYPHVHHEVGLVRECHGVGGFQ